MTSLVCDTSGLLALFDRTDPAHFEVFEFLQGGRDSLVVSPCVLAELDHLVRSRFGGHAARLVADELAGGAYDIATLTASKLRACAALDRQYADLNLGLTDTHVMRLAFSEKGSGVLTLDHRHFRAVVGPTGEPLRLVPADS